ncbi:MAG: hypothetical protein FWH49_03750 [Clostridiales bacterium]|nr:hypothetical protein [Clostridiales bacterium]
MMLTFLRRKPWLVLRFFSAVSEYYQCQLNILLLYKEADKVRTEENSSLLDRIIQNACDCLVRSAYEDWPELIGLSAQKIVHLAYHDDLISGKYDSAKKGAEIQSQRQ